MRFFKKDARELVMVVLRFAAAAIFLWFGIDKWVHPEAWYGWVPTFLWPMLPGEAIDHFMNAVGLFEVALGLVLASGTWLRVASAVSFLYLLMVTLTVGPNAVAVGDLSLMGLPLALFLHADAEAEHRLPSQVISVIVGAYILLLFLFGVLYLRAAPVP